MVKINAFKSIRPNKELVKEIAALPYDVLNSDEARKMAQNNPYSYLHIDKAEIDLDETISAYDKTVYEKAKKNLGSFLENGWLKKDDTNSLYLYELTMNGNSQLGLVTCTSIHDYLENKIKKHELTRADKELDRINHIKACHANTSPIFLTYRDNDKINTLTNNWINTHSPEYDFTHFYDVTHRVWVIDDQRVIQELTQLFDKEVSELYIADGHHRTESAVKVGQEKIKTFGNLPEAPYQQFLSVLFPKNELKIYDYNRSLNIPITKEHFKELSTYFDITKTKKEQVKPAKNHEFGMYYQENWHKLVLKKSFLEREIGVLNQLSAALFQKYIAETIFKIQDIRTDERIDFIGGIRGLNELESLVDQEKATVTFALKEATMDDLLTVADKEEIMPPKSTWFEPKLLSGLFLHDLGTN